MPRTMSWKHVGELFFWILFHSLEKTFLVVLFSLENCTKQRDYSVIRYFVSQKKGWEARKTVIPEKVKVFGRRMEIKCCVRKTNSKCRRCWKWHHTNDFFSFFLDLLFVFWEKVFFFGKNYYVCYVCWTGYVFFLSLWRGGWERKTQGAQFCRVEVVKSSKCDTPCLSLLTWSKNFPHQSTAPFLTQESFREKEKGTLCEFNFLSSKIIRRPNEVEYLWWSVTRRRNCG